MDLSSSQKNNLLKKSEETIANFFVTLKKFFLSTKKKEDNDKHLVYSLAASKIPRREQIKHLAKLLNPREKLLFKISILVLIISSSYLLFNFYQDNLILIAKEGGSYTEGVSAYPQNINPLYSNNRDIDSDLSRLIYSSLFSYNDKGVLSPDLVENWQVSEDGKEYRIKIRENVFWHNGNALTADDVIFTANLIKTPEFKSSLRSSLNGVNLEQIDNYSIRFILVEPYADFLHLLNFGIMPKFAWENTSPDTIGTSILNIEPIGSGPYQYSSMIKSKGGELKEYHLSLNEVYYGTKPYISKLIFKFYPSYNELVSAFNANNIDGASYIPADLKSDILGKQSLNFHQLQLAQINLAFFNQEKNSFLQDLKLRQALNWSLNKEGVIKGLLNGEAVLQNSPIIAPEYMLKSDDSAFDLERAAKSLEEAGFKKIVSSESDFSNEEGLSEDLKIIKKFAEENKLGLGGSWLLKDAKVLSLKLSYPESYGDELALSMQKDWQELGLKVILDKISSESVKDRIEKRDFEVLLFGQAAGLNPDIAAFWHSTQATKQGLNLAQYKNSEVDTLLTEARKSTNNEDRVVKYALVQEKIKADVPVIFLYSPNYIYIQSKKVRGFKSSLINTASDRFAGIADWHVRTKKRFTW